MTEPEIYLSRLPSNTFAAIYAECELHAFSGAVFNGVYYSEWEIYIASQYRDEGYDSI